MPSPVPFAPSRLATAVACAFLLAGGLPIAADVSCPSTEVLQGAWVERGGEGQFLFEPERIVVQENGLLRAASLQRREPCKLVVRDQGVLSTWTIKVDEHALLLDRGKGFSSLDRLPKIPAALDLSPLPLPPPMPVSAETASAIARELADRSEKDQAALHSETLNRTTVLEDNIRYLREVVARYGWIDIPRFGKAGAAAAILIVKHSADLRLSQYALPIAERDARDNGGGKELVAILVDSMLIDTGHKQKYGSQITEDANGKPYVIPVEDSTKVDTYRQELGLQPWSDYLVKASQVLYGGVPIRIPGPEE